MIGTDKRFSGQKLRDLRKARGMSRTVLAAEVGRVMDTVGAWERDEAEPHLGSFYALVDILGCAPDDLLIDVSTVRGNELR